MSKPKLFVGSSSEAKNAVRVLCSALADAATVIPWWDAPEFKRGSFATLDSLMAAVDAYDFAVFLLTPDDLVNSRGKEGSVARDNVVFEFGLFLGRLGQHRAFAFVEERPAKGALKVPSDLFGINMPRFRVSSDPHEMMAGLSHAAEIVRIAINNCTDWWHLYLEVIRSWGSDHDKGTFNVTLGEAPLKRYATKLHNRAFVLVVRKQDENVNKKDDRRIVIGKSRAFDGHLEGDIVLTAKSAAIIGRCGVGDVLEAYVFATPMDVDISDVKTIAELITKGARLLKVVGQTRR